MRLVQVSSRDAPGRRKELNANMQDLVKVCKGVGTVYFRVDSVGVKHEFKELFQVPHIDRNISIPPGYRLESLRGKVWGGESTVGIDALLPCPLVE
jgi:hypothetical protein